MEVLSHSSVQFACVIVCLPPIGYFSDYINETTRDRDRFLKSSRKICHGHETDSVRSKTAAVDRSVLERTIPDDT